ncbi:hypothetical protein NQ318_021377, partial [Aromia moschata]
MRHSDREPNYSRDKRELQFKGLKGPFGHFRETSVDRTLRHVKDEDEEKRSGVVKREICHQTFDLVDPVDYVGGKTRVITRLSLTDCIQKNVVLMSYILCAYNNGKLSDEVTRKKTEYQKYLELYKLMRCKFEEHYVKCGRGGRKLDEVRDKYQKACRKLHLTHNEYVLLLCEAVEFEKDFRTVLLPGLLEHQQSLQEAFISTWKQILLDVANNSDLTSEKFKEIQKKIETSIESIRPCDEYRDFTEKHKTTPTEPVKFTFDESLVEDSAGKLLPNQLTVDNLTVEWLRTKLGDLETSIKENQEKRTAITTNHDGLVNGKSTPNNEVNNRLSTASVDTSKKEINELKCRPELIKSALNELGCEEAPAACELSIDNQTFITNTSEQGNGSESTLSKRTMFERQRIFNMLRKPFRRKSAPSSPIAPPRTKGRRDSAPRSEGGDP